MDGRDFKLFNESLDRCLCQPGFMDHFYEIFLASDQEIVDKFVDTDFQEQKRMLRLSLYMIVSIGQSMPEAESHFERIAELHSSRRLNIRPQLYNVWLDSLLQAARAHDQLFDLELEKVWRNIMAYGIEFMRIRY